VSQWGEHEGSPGLGGDDISRTQHPEDLRRNKNRDVEKVETERPRPRAASSKAPGEQVLQRDEREGSPGSCRRAQRQVDLSQRAGAAVSKKRRLPSGSERASEAKRRPAQRPSCEARTCEFICRREAERDIITSGNKGCPQNKISLPVVARAVHRTRNIADCGSRCCLLQETSAGSGSCRPAAVAIAVNRSRRSAVTIGRGSGSC
jgi:hypothetical protein